MPMSAPAAGAVRRTFLPRKVRHATRRLGQRYEAYRAGTLAFAEFDAGVRGWINHVRQADSWGLRRRLLAPFVLKPGDVPRRRATTGPGKSSRAPRSGAQ
jgi:hypothetical protein